MTRDVFRPAAGSKPGILVLSGLDGTGKSSQARILSERLFGSGIRVNTIWNRWKPVLTLPLIKMARRSISPVRDAQTADYSNFTEKKRDRMRSPLKRDLWQTVVWSEYAMQVNFRLAVGGYPFRGIISDRYVYDTLVDMAINFSATSTDLERLCEHALFSLFPRPAKLIVIDIDPEVGARRKSDGTPPEYLADRRQLYLEMARITGAPVIDGCGSIENIAEEIWESSSEWRATLTAQGKDLEE